MCILRDTVTFSHFYLILFAVMSFFLNLFAKMSFVTAMNTN